ncbi:MAG: tRNA (adenosine(37)-N6)-threonylcarbamoyltransferase complex ATPase subunit type 1 TsaE [Spirochaetota bacterium]
MAAFPAVILLEGELGAGKTVFCRGIARVLGIEGPVQSPTFPVLLEYEGNLPLYHFDLYRLADSEEFDLIGGEDILCGDGSYGSGISVIEWPERLDWPDRRWVSPCLRVCFRMDKGSDYREREIEIRRL